MLGGGGGGGCKSCLVIGGAGNLGSHIVEVLLAQKNRVTTFDLPGVVPSSRTSRTDDHGGVKQFHGDVTCEEDLVRAFRESEATIVFHTASVIDLRPVVSPTMRKVNVDGTQCVLRASAREDTFVETIVYTSSLEVVSGRDAEGNLQVVNGGDEDLPYAVEHHLPYGTTKCEAEQLVLEADGTSVTSSSTRTIRTCAIRPGYIMGAGCIGLRIEILTSLKKRAGWYIAAKIPARISVVHARNCAAMHVLAAQQIEKTDVHGKAFFCRDFEDNVVEMNVECFTKYTGIKCTMIPLRFAMFMAFLLDRIERVLIFVYAVFGSVRLTPMDVISYKTAMMAYQDIIVSDKRGRLVLGYEPTVGRDECMRESGEWCKEFYARTASELSISSKKTD